MSMNIEQVREACLAAGAAVEEGSPFAALGHPDVAFKVGGKIFAFLCVPESPSCRHADAADLLVVKSDPDEALALRERYPDVIEPAWHWNKKYWIQLHYRQLPAQVVTRLIGESYRLVIDKLPKKVKAELNL